MSVFWLELHFLQRQLWPSIGHSNHAKNTKKHVRLLQNVSEDDYVINFVIVGVVVQQGINWSNWISLWVPLSQKSGWAILFSVAEEAFTNLVSSDLVVFKTFFGRMGSLWMLYGKKHRWSHENYVKCFKFDAAFTTLHVIWHSLRNGDNE